MDPFRQRLGGVSHLKPFYAACAIVVSHKVQVEAKHFRNVTG